MMENCGFRTQNKRKEWYEEVMKRKEEEKTADIHRNKREAEKTDKFFIALGVRAGQLGRFRAALIGPLRPRPLTATLVAP